MLRGRSSLSMPDESVPGFVMRSSRLRQIIWVSMAAVGASLLYRVFAGWSWDSAEYFLILTFVLFSLCAWLSRIGHYRYAVTLFVVTTTAMACGLIYSTAGLHDEATVILPAVLLFACMFGSRRQFFMLLGSLIIFLAAITVANETGWHALDDKNGSNMSAFINVAVILTASGFFAMVLADDLHRALTDLHGSRRDLLELNDQLESRVEQRTVEIEAANKALHESMEQLEKAIKELMHAEKLASLGSMVAGISHELNTPIGNALLAASTLARLFESAQAQIDSGQMKRRGMEDFFKEGVEMSTLITRSTLRAAEMVSSFKQVAVDQTSEQRRVFDLKAVIDDNLSAIAPNFKKRPITMVNEVPPDLRLDSFPGPLGQILTNLIQNAIVHGFEPKGGGQLTIRSVEHPNQVLLVVQDNGVGMAQHVVAHVFDPFFTTRLGQGGSGLGLSISHRIATSVLGGDLRVESSEGGGATFTLVLPKVAPFPIR